MDIDFLNNGLSYDIFQFSLHPRRVQKRNKLKGAFLLKNLSIGFGEKGIHENLISYFLISKNIHV